MLSIRGLSIIVVILALLSVVLGWQVFSMRQSAGGQTNVLSQRNAELAQLKEKLASQSNDLAQAREANNRANQIYLDVTKQGIWHIRVGQSIAAREVVLSIVPQANGTAVRMAVALQPLLFGSSRAVRVLTTAPNWGADDKVLPMEDGVVRLEYQFPTAVTEATISLAP
jgi:hypothetical protein